MEYAYKTTTHGRAAMAAYMALGDKPFRITRVVFGSGLVDEETNLADVHELVAYVTDGAVADRSHKDERLTLTIQFANSQHPDVPTFLLSEFIVYVEDPATGEDTDLLYGTLGDYRQPVPAYNPAYPPSVFNFPLELILSDEINVICAAPAGLATWEDLNRVAPRQTGIAIPTEGWAETGSEKYPFVLELPVDGVMPQTIPALTVLEAGEDSVSACGLAPRVETLAGAVRFFAHSAPAAPIPAVLTLQGAGSGPLDGGAGLTPGDGLMLDASGNLAVNFAARDEVKNIFKDSNG